MTEPPPHRADGEPWAHDLEYDLAHEAFDQRCIGPGGERRHEPGLAPVRTDDYDGDYGYDLAHDIPRRPKG